MEQEPDFHQQHQEQTNSLLSLQIPIGAAWAIFLTLVTGAIWTSAQLWDLRQSIKDGTGDRWKKSYQREWGHRLRDQNPTVKVPDPDQVVKDLD